MKTGREGSEIEDGSAILDGLMRLSVLDSATDRQALTARAVASPLGRLLGLTPEAIRHACQAEREGDA